MHVPDARLELLTSYYAAWNEGGIEAVLGMWTDTFEWHDAPDMPGGEAFIGREAAHAHFRDLQGTLGRMPVEVLEMAPGPDEVLVVLKVTLDGSISGVVVDGPIYESVRIVDGRVDRIRLFLDRDAAAQAAGAAP